MALLDNLLGIDNEAELARAEERLTKRRAVQLYDAGIIDRIEVGTFDGLAEIHKYLFQDIYPWAGQMRSVNIAKSNFYFAPVMFLRQSVDYVSGLPQKTYEEIIRKYVEMNVAHPFREGNGRSTRIWLDCILKAELGVVVDWSKVSKSDYLLAMERSPVKDLEIRFLLKGALTDHIRDRDVYMKGIDASYHYEGYSSFAAKDLSPRSRNNPDR